MYYKKNSFKTKTVKKVQGYLHFQVVESIVVLSEECQSPDTGEKKCDTALCIL